MIASIFFISFHSTALTSKPLGLGRSLGQIYGEHVGPVWAVLALMMPSRFEDGTEARYSLDSFGLGSGSGRFGLDDVAGTKIGPKESD